MNRYKAVVNLNGKLPNPVRKHSFNVIRFGLRKGLDLSVDLVSLLALVVLSFFGSPPP